jgi:hypothetical protein
MDVEHLLQCVNFSATNYFTGIVCQQYLCVFQYTGTSHTMLVALVCNFLVNFRH